MREVALDVDVAIHDHRGVEVAGRQRQQVQLFTLMTLPRRLLAITQEAYVGNGVRCRASQLPARLKRGSRSAVGRPRAWANASRGFSSTKAACSGDAPCNSSMTPLTSWAVSVSRRVSASTACWLPAGNRVSCRANAGPNRPRRRSSFTAALSRSSRASRRQTQLLCWPRRCAASTCVSPSSRTNACTIHASSSSRAPR